MGGVITSTITAADTSEGRFKAFPIETDEHLLTVLQSVQRNPPRARMVLEAEQWARTSLTWRHTAKRPEMLSNPLTTIPRS